MALHEVKRDKKSKGANKKKGAKRGAKGAQRGANRKNKCGKKGEAKRFQVPKHVVHSSIVLTPLGFNVFEMICKWYLIESVQLFETKNS